MPMMNNRSLNIKNCFKERILSKDIAWLYSKIFFNFKFSTNLRKEKNFSLTLVEVVITNYVRNRIKKFRQTKKRVVIGI